MKKNPVYLKSIYSSALLLGAALLTTPAYADKTGGLWMLLGDGDKLEAGVTPNRVMHFAYPAHIRDLTDQNAKIAEIMRDTNPKTIDARLKAMEIAEMDVIEIFEHPKAPGFKMLTMQFQCTKKLYRVAKAEWKERNSLHRFSGETEWQQYVPTDWQSRAYFVACFPEIWQPMAKAEVQEMGRTKAATKQAGLREYGVGLIGAWTKNEGINQVYRLTWDKMWAGSATPVPFHHNRTAAEEKEYQAWKKGNDAVLAENEKAAPMILSSIAAHEGQVTGQLKGLDEEKAFQDEIAKNFKKHKSKYYATFKGLTEEQLVEVRGVPTSTTTNGNLRSILYAYSTAWRTETPVHDNSGNVMGTNVDFQTLNCDVTFKLRVGGSQAQYRVVDYQLNRDMGIQGYGKCD
jgi:hypothetical protein